MTQSSVVDAAGGRKSSDAASEVDPWDLVDEEDDVVKWSGTDQRYDISQVLQSKLNTPVRK